jgi:hypothetical protein
MKGKTKMGSNIQKLKKDHKDVVGRIRVVKKALRSPWTKPMDSYQYELISLKRQATEFCILRAWLRGKQHLPDPLYCKEIAERLAKQYKTKEVAA